MQSLGATTAFIHVCPKTTDKMGPVILQIRVDVVNSDAPMLISHESIRLMNWSIDFSPIALLIPSVAKIKLGEYGIRTLDDSRTTTRGKVLKELSVGNHSVYSMEMKLPTRAISEEIAKIHAQLEQCSENTSSPTIRAAQMRCDLFGIQKVLGMQMPDFCAKNPPSARFFLVGKVQRGNSRPRYYFPIRRPLWRKIGQRLPGIICDRHPIKIH